jgi:hypothetical protein
MYNSHIEISQVPIIYPSSSGVLFSLQPFNSGPTTVIAFPTTWGVELLEQLLIKSAAAS